MSEVLRTLAPQVRGLNRISETGAFVRCVTDSAGTGSTQAPNLEISDPGKDAFEAAYHKYCSKHGTHPAVIVIAGEGALCVGRTFDEARDVEKAYLASGSAPKELTVPASGDPGEVSRNDIVKERISVVTGGAQGFGESIVRELISAGAFVWIADINMDGAKKLSDELNAAAGRTVSMPVAVNVMDEASVADMAATIVTECGGIDLYVSNAGVVKAGSVKEIELSDFNFVTSVNYTGYFLGVKHVSPVMALQNSDGAPYYTDIIQINSKSGLEGSNKNGAYAGGKFGGIGLTQSFALELVTDNIKVNSICPGNFFDGPLWSDPDRGLFVQYLNAGKVPGAKSVADVRKFYEEKVPMNRGCTGRDVIRAIYYIIDQKYETGQAVPVTGGQVMLR